MNKRIQLKLGAVSILLTIIVSMLKLIQGWEIVAFSVLTFVLLYFSLFFVKYVDDQKSFTSLPDSQEGDDLQ